MQSARDVLTLERAPARRHELARGKRPRRECHVAERRAVLPHAQLEVAAVREEGGRGRGLRLRTTEGLRRQCSSSSCGTARADPSGRRRSRAVGSASRRRAPTCQAASCALRASARPHASGHTPRSTIAKTPKARAAMLSGRLLVVGRARRPAATSMAARCRSGPGGPPGAVAAYARGSATRGTLWRHGTCWWVARRRAGASTCPRHPRPHRPRRTSPSTSDALSGRAGGRCPK